MIGNFSESACTFSGLLKKSKPVCAVLMAGSSSAKDIVARKTYMDSFAWLLLSNRSVIVNVSVWFGNYIPAVQKGTVAHQYLSS